MKIRKTTRKSTGIKIALLISAIDILVIILAFCFFMLGVAQRAGGQVAQITTQQEYKIKVARLHHLLADWYIYPGAFAKWEMGSTSFPDWLENKVVDKYGRPKLELKIEPSICLTDKQLLNKYRPINLLYITGHDREHAVMPVIYSTGKKEILQEHFSCIERDAFRKYILTGGIIFFDDGGPSDEFTQRFIRELKIIFPKEKIIEIPKDHEIYHVIFDFQTLPLGWDLYKHKKAEPRPIKGLEINGRLAVIISQNYLLPGMENLALDPDIAGYISQSDWEKLTADIYRFITNLFFYTRK